jgi:hypothetical protein
VDEYLDEAEKVCFVVVRIQKQGSPSRPVNGCSELNKVFISRLRREIGDPFSK